LSATIGVFAGQLNILVPNRPVAKKEDLTQRRGGRGIEER
jgi:hypothetical protein